MPTQLALFDESLEREEESKHCPGCDEEKPLSFYYRRKASPDGYGHRCANCENPSRQSIGPVQRVQDSDSRRKRRKHAGRGYNYCVSRQKLKPEVMERDIFCRACGSTVDLEVHYVSPDPVQRDNLDYLTCFCIDCHRKLHNVTAR